jgi:GNAT superfamily N-acetyltransferase
LTPPSSSGAAIPVRPIRFWQHGRAVRQMLRAYPPGTDALVDQIRSASPLARFAFERVLAPLYFAREQGWAVRGERQPLAAIMYLRRDARHGIRVLHIDDINVDADYRHRGFGQRLMGLAEDLARQERRPFLKLAVTVANTPAVTLYRQLGYQEQHHRYFTHAPSGTSLPVAVGVTLRPLRPRAAQAANRRFYRVEMRASAPEVADVMVTYYPRAAGGEGVPMAGERAYAIERDGQEIGYGDAYRKRHQWQLRLSLQPDVWGTALERQAIQLLANTVTGAQGHGSGTAFALHVPSGAHFDALCAGSPSLASELGLVEQSYDRMIMVKVVASGL